MVASVSLSFILSFIFLFSSLFHHCAARHPVLARHEQSHPSTLPQQRNTYSAVQQPQYHIEKWSEVPTTRSLRRRDQPLNRPLSHLEKWGKVLPSRSLSRRAPQPRLDSKAKRKLENRGYTVGRFLGAGAFGDVFAVSKRGKTYAAKMAIRSGYSGSSSTIRSVSKEADLYQALGHHPYILEFKEKIQWEGGVIMIVELAKASDMTTWLSTQKYFKMTTVMRNMYMITSALKHAKDMNVHHLDIKPDNLLAIEDKYTPGRILLKIADWGCAKSGTFGRPYGDRKYMAPEGSAHPDRDADLEKLDVFSLGITFFELLNSRRPFGTSASQIKDGATSGSWGRYIQALPGSKNWVKLFAMMMHPNPQARAPLWEVMATLESMARGYGYDYRAW